MFTFTAVIVSTNWDYVLSKKVIIYLVFMACSYCCKAQNGLQQALVEAGFENVMIKSTADRDIIAVENSAYKLNAVGIQKSINLVIGSDSAYRDRKVTLIVLDNNVPQVSVNFGTAGAENDLDVSYNLDQAWREIREVKRVNSSLFKADIIVYPDFMFRNIKYDRVYDIVVNFSPALEISLWKGMLFTGQVIFPIVNQYGERFSTIRPGFITLSQAFRLPANWFARGTVGTFADNRWGADLRVFHPFGRGGKGQFAVKGDVSLTGPSDFDGFYWNYGDARRVSWNMGADYYYRRYNLQFSLSGGRYLGGDYGVRADMARHFKSSSVGFYVQKSNKTSVTGSVNGGFYFTIALPPYKHKRGKVGRVTTPDYFGITYNAGADFIYGRTLKISPSQNVSQYNFNPQFLESQIEIKN